MYVKWFYAGACCIIKWLFSALQDWNVFLESFSKLELCILQHNVSLDSFPEMASIPPPRRRKKKLKWAPWKTGETESVCAFFPICIFELLFF